MYFFEYVFVILKYENVSNIEDNAAVREGGEERDATEGFHGEHRDGVAKQCDSEGEGRERGFGGEGEDGYKGGGEDGTLGDATCVWYDDGGGVAIPAAGKKMAAKSMAAMTTTKSECEVDVKVRERTRSSKRSFLSVNLLLLSFPCGSKINMLM